MSDVISVVVADDHSIFRAGVIQALALESSIEVVAEAASAQDAVRMVETFRPDVALIDLSMPGGGVDAVRSIAASHPDVAVAVLTASENEADILQSLRAGAMGYMLKGLEAPQLIAAVKALASGNSYLPPNLAIRLLSDNRKDARSIARERYDTLSKQEKRVLRLVAKGDSNRDIAVTLGVQEHTTKFHVTNIMSKLGLRNRVEAAIFAREHEEID
jgi:two-component system, NarL family, nitrate/nitrite response regulator NarL